MVKKGVILTGGYSDYYNCKRPLYSMYLVGFIFTVFVDSVVFLLPQEQVYSGLIDFFWYLQYKVRLMRCMVLLYCISRGCYVWGLF